MERLQHEHSVITVSILVKKSDIVGRVHGTDRVTLSPSLKTVRAFEGLNWLEALRRVQAKCKDEITQIKAELQQYEGEAKAELSAVDTELQMLFKKKLTVKWKIYDAVSWGMLVFFDIGQ